MTLDRVALLNMHVFDRERFEYLLITQPFAAEAYVTGASKVVYSNQFSCPEDGIPLQHKFPTLAPVYLDSMFDDSGNPTSDFEVHFYGHKDNKPYLLVIRRLNNMDHYIVLSENSIVSDAASRDILQGRKIFTPVVPPYTMDDIVELSVDLYLLNRPEIDDEEYDRLTTYILDTLRAKVPQNGITHIN